MELMYCVSFLSCFFEFTEMICYVLYMSLYSNAILSNFCDFKDVLVLSTPFAPHQHVY